MYIYKFMWMHSDSWNKKLQNMSHIWNILAMHQLLSISWIMQAELSFNPGGHENLIT